MNSFILLQVSENVVRKSAEMAVKDPHGAIITLVSVSVVFVALIVLYFAYSFIGKLSSGKISLKLPKKEKKKAAATGAPTSEEAAAIAMALDQEMNGEVYAAISLALHQYLNGTVHDNESYIITIKRKK
ncbi:MAG: OadG family protein [Bacteroidales bacterium]|nr:OadG family protein [Bacteroidales bacterium]